MLTIKKSPFQMMFEQMELRYTREAISLVGKTCWQMVQEHLVVGVVDKEKTAVILTLLMISLSTNYISEAAEEEEEAEEAAAAEAAEATEEAAEEAEEAEEAALIIVAGEDDEPPFVWVDCRI